MRILQLSTEVANQIAAGEVIERPASVVKELLENALDAQADAITIDIGFGGLNQIKVSDNGQGIVADDLPLAIAPHATSKIIKLEDLAAIGSLGFRGEALASITSVAKVTISSKPAMQEHGMLLTCQYQDATLTPFPRVRGTTVDVCDLFYNAPVRKRFLKTEQTEFQAIDLLVRRFALSAPHIAIKLNHNGKTCLSLPAATEPSAQQARISRLLGKQFMEQASYIDVEHQGLQLCGWISGSNYQRSQNDKLWVYVNGRMVKDKLINHAIKQVYEPLLHPGRHPACVLYLTISPYEVDVNVHPTKHEVRFQQPRLVHDFINTQLRYALKLSNDSLQGTEWPKYAPSNNFLEVKEREVFSSWNSSVNTNTTLNSWFKLNKRFVIILIAQMPYLIDLPRLKVHWLEQQLNNTTLPLKTRTLLVPIYINSPLLAYKELEQARMLLEQVGVHVQLVKGQRLLVHSLPSLIPDLRLKEFLHSFFSSTNWNKEKLISLLIHASLQEDGSVTEEECKNYLFYLEKKQVALNKKFAKQLTEAVCQDLLYAK